MVGTPVGPSTMRLRNNNTGIAFTASSVVLIAGNMYTAPQEYEANPEEQQRMTIVEYADKGMADEFEAQLKLGVSPNIYRDGTTALIAAADHGYDDIVDLLLKSKANPNLVEKDESSGGIITPRRSPLMAAVDNGSMKCVSMLLKAGADPRYVNTNKHVCILDESSDPKMTAMLLEAVNSTLPPAPAVKLNPADRADMVYIPAGAFPMGEGFLDDDHMRHTVYLDSYWI